MLRYLHSNATPLSTENIQDIIKAKNSIKWIPEAMANKYKISIRQVYQIWRGVYPPIDLHFFLINSEKNLDNKSIPPFDFVEEGGIKDQGAESILSDLGSEGLNISQEDLIAFYEKEAIRDKKNIAKFKYILAK